MSRKKSNSTLPAEFNENWGSNYMMDGFWHDMDYGKGLRDEIGADPVPQPSTSGYSHIPDGVLMGKDNEPEFHDLPEAIEIEDDGVDLANLEIVASFDPTSDPSSTGVVDHEWLGEAYQDPSRLPQNSTDDGIDELQQAWGDRTDGIRRIDMCDRIETQPNLGEARDNHTITQQLLVATVQSAMRRSAAGEAPTILAAEARRILGDAGFQRVARAFSALAKEHGLVGQVYVRASAYPGLHRGKWAPALKKAAGTAKYIVEASGEDTQGAASALGLRVVKHPDQINWQRALAHYAPRLRASGRLPQRVASGDERETLRKAFLRESTSPRLHIESLKPIETRPADTVSLEDAKRVFAATPETPRVQVIDDRGVVGEERKLVRRLGTMVKARLISNEEAEALCKASGAAHARLKMAELLAARTKQGHYKGGVVGDARVGISAEEFAAAPASRHTDHAKRASLVQEVSRRELLERFLTLQEIVRSASGKVGEITAAVDGGLRGAALRKKVASLLNDRERKIVARDLDPVLVRGGFYEPEQPKTREFAGPHLREAAPSKHERPVSPQEIAGIVRWALLQMNDGFVGDDLDHLLKRRFPAVLLKAASQEIAQAREQHEALAGHLYVDAASYATAEGTKGCEAGALRHRANGIKHVLAMPRCASCVCRNPGGVCQKYNKQLVAGVAPPVASEYRREVLAAARRADNETTAALFSTPDLRSAVADPVSEFGLHNGSLDDVATTELGYEGIGDIFFGGLEV